MTSWLMIVFLWNPANGMPIHFKERFATEAQCIATVEALKQHDENRFVPGLLIRQLKPGSRRIVEAWACVETPAPVTP